VVLACAGCGGGGPELASVSGTVTLDGQPLSDAMVIFIPENGRQAAARTDTAGKYVLTFKEGRQGAEPGKYKVRITTGRAAGEDDDGHETEPVPEKVPMKYNAQTELEYTVEAGKENVADFPLESGGEVRPVE